MKFFPLLWLILLPGFAIHDLHAQGLDGYGGGPVIYLKLFNDGVYTKELSFIVHSSRTFGYQKDWQEGRITTQQAVADAYVVWLVQDMAGEFTEVSRRDWEDVAKKRRGAPIDWDLVVDLITLPFDAVGDAAAGVYYLVNGDYESASYCIIAIAVPFANGQMIKAGKYLVSKGTKGAQRLMELTPEEIWKLKPGLRGELIEDILVKTRYQASRGFTHMREASWYWPVFDVVKDDMIISIKTTQVTTGFGSLYANIRDLRWLVMSNKTLNGSTVIQQARLDVYVPADYNKSMLNQVQNFVGRTHDKFSIVGIKCFLGDKNLHEYS